MPDDLREDPHESARRSGEQSGMTLGRLLEGVDNLNDRLSETKAEIQALTGKMDDLAKEVTRIKTGVAIFKWVVAPVIGILSLALALVSIGLMLYRIMSGGPPG